MGQNLTFPIILLWSEKPVLLYPNNYFTCELGHSPKLSEGLIHRRLQYLPCGTVFLQHRTLTALCCKYHYVMTGYGHVFI